MPSSAGVVQEAGVPRRPSTSTRQSRQEPKGSSESVAQSFGILVPSDIAAAITEVPAGTVTLSPSIVSVTVFSAMRIGVPKSISLIRLIEISSFGGERIARPVEIIGKQVQRAHHRHGDQAAQGAERGVAH